MLVPPFVATAGDATVQLLKAALVWATALDFSYVTATSNSEDKYHYIFFG
jgi:hypothetical protein